MSSCIVCEHKYSSVYYIDVSYLNDEWTVMKHIILGRSIPDQVTFISPPDHVQQYIEDMKEQYKYQPIITTDWPPRVGREFFGRLVLVEKKSTVTAGQNKHKKSAWYMLRGQVDQIPKLPGCKEIDIKNLLQPVSKSPQSLRVVIDGPPGIGKTTLCRYLLQMWSSGTLIHQHNHLVLYCPLRNSRIAEATKLSDLFVYESAKVLKVVDWVLDREGEGLMIIFDGWDEMSVKLRQSSLPTKIIRGEKLYKCSVIVTSRSYASSSLLDTISLNSLSRYVQILGFTSNEIFTVIIRTIQENPKLAQELIDENKSWSSCNTTQNNEESILAVKLINDLQVREDVQSLCYVPLICSMVILVYCKEGGHLPTTLTQLYENFILQTIRRHVKRRGTGPSVYTLGSLSSLPPHLTKCFQEICHIAYTNLANKVMTFSSHQIHEQSHLSEAIKEDYLGLMTTFMEYDEQKYQFLHLSIQEFLAAWWIARYEEKTEEVFKVHFDDDHFRLCLRFVAGLTHLQHESYQQYFNKELDLTCKRRMLFGFDSYTRFRFYHNPEINTDVKDRNDHINVLPEEFPTLLIHLLYESQNIALCPILAQSMNSHSLCLHQTLSSQFDTICFSYFIENSKQIWETLHFKVLHTSLFISELAASSQTQCKRLDVKFFDATDELIVKFWQPSLTYNVQECYCNIDGKYTPYLVLLQLLKLPQAKVLHITMDSYEKPSKTVYPNGSGLQECIEMNSKLQELMIQCHGYYNESRTFSDVIQGVAKNKTITSLSLFLSFFGFKLRGGRIELMLKDNNTLKALVLNIPDPYIPEFDILLLPKSLLCIDEVNAPLSALKIGFEYKLKASLLKYIESLILLEPQQPHFLSHCPHLQTLDLPLETVDSAVKLFTILQTNTSIIALRVEISHLMEFMHEDVICDSLYDMLVQNRTLNCLEIEKTLIGYSSFLRPRIPSAFLSSVAKGLMQNTSIHKLRIPLTVAFKEDGYFLIDVISKRNILSELQLDFFNRSQCLVSNFKADESPSSSPSYSLSSISSSSLLSEDFREIFIEQVLPTITKMLQSLTNIKLFGIQHVEYNSVFFADEYDQQFLDEQAEHVEHFYETVFLHPSLKYVELDVNIKEMAKAFLEEKRKSLIAKVKQRHPLKSLPILGYLNETQ